MKTARSPILPDMLRSGLDLVFCGTAAGTLSAKLGQYYANPQSKFWKILHQTGLTPRQLAPHEYAKLLDHSIGLTDLAKHASGMDSALPPAALGAQALRTLRRKIEDLQPKWLAFTSLNGGRRFVGRMTASPGAQPETIGATRIWILPSPSPLAHNHWDERPWQDLAKTVRGNSWSNLRST
jgi:double-stranded uracil-DNA glycosylase